LILQWIKKNADKFADYDFTDIPDSAFISTADLLNRNDTGAASGPARSLKEPLTFKTVEDVKRWFRNPEKHPIKETPMSAMSNEYYNIYERAYKIMKATELKSVEMKNEYYFIQNNFPKNHLLFGNIDLVYFACVKKYVNYYSKLYQGREDVLELCQLLTEKIEDTTDKTTVLDTEIELLRNRFNGSNMFSIKNLIKNYKRDIVNAFLRYDFMSSDEYPKRMEVIQEDVDNPECYSFIKFLETNKMANGETPIKYFINCLKKSNPPYWISETLKLYNNCNFWLLRI